MLTLALLNPLIEFQTAVTANLNSDLVEHNVECEEEFKSLPDQNVIPPELEKKLTNNFHLKNITLLRGRIGEFKNFEVRETARQDLPDGFAELIALFTPPVFSYGGNNLPLKSFVVLSPRFMKGPIGLDGKEELTEEEEAKRQQSTEQDREGLCKHLARIYYNINIIHSIALPLIALSVKFAIATLLPTLSGFLWFAAAAATMMVAVSLYKKAEDTFINYKLSRCLSNDTIVQLEKSDGLFHGYSHWVPSWNQ